MRVSVGADILHLGRLDGVLGVEGQDGWDAVFTRAERELGNAHPQPERFLAGRFAAKEAIFKSLEVGWEAGMEWSQIEVLSAENEGPTVVMHGPFAALVPAGASLSVSISSDVDFVIAVCAFSR